jgi:hypothetical protein
VAGHLQAAGQEYRGEILNVLTDGSRKSIDIEFGHAYPVVCLTSARRSLTLLAEGTQAGTVWVEDRFQFTEPAEAEEAFVTWGDVAVDGATATIHGAAHGLRITIEEPTDTIWQVEELAEQSKVNNMHGVLKRLRFALKPATESVGRVRLDIV